MSDWQMAQMMSNATGLDLENTCSNILGARIQANNRTIRNIDDLNAALNKSPFQPLSKSCLPGVSAKDFVDMATKNFGMNSSEATAVFARETGRDLESVVYELSGPDINPINGTFSAPPMTSLGRSSASFAGRPTRTNESPIGAFLPPQARGGTLQTTVHSYASSEADRELLARVQNVDLSDSNREEALRELIDHNAVEELHVLVNDADRCDTWRKRSLDALCREAGRSDAALRCLDRLVNNPDRCDSWRKQALNTLCEVSQSSSTALELLYRLVNNADRCDSWRSQSLKAVIRSERIDLLENLVNNPDRCDSWRKECLDALCENTSSREVAESLLRLVNNMDRCDSWRHQALQALIAGRCRNQLREIADNTERCSSWRREAREALE